LGAKLLLGNSSAASKPCVDIKYSNTYPYNSFAHECVGKIQENLNRWRVLVPVRIGQGQPGHKLKIDSIFGPDTESQVEVFQTSNGIEASGVVGHRTWEAICEDASYLQYSSYGVGCSTL